ncbi:Crp/Fnr family transcriptional regulator [Pedobacter sp. AW1-32]|uniref:Crp/Fnr family transcriptional regulator n=1 Tax=Pedobacter sp. AW1-32 TaxID=3383026 RepID=UPI003FEFCEDE
MSKTAIQSALFPLLGYLGQFHHLSAEFIALHEKQCKIIHIKKYKYILSPLDHNANLYFLVIGMVRGFIKEGDKDISTWFSFGNEIIGAMRNPTAANQPSIEYLQALDHCELIIIPRALIENAYMSYPEGIIINRHLMALSYYSASERAILARIPNASERYRKLGEEGFDFSKIPMRYLASYLGMRLETLSRIRHKFTNAHLQLA